jgi:hypothetical protein
MSEIPYCLQQLGALNGTSSTRIFLSFVLAKTNFKPLFLSLLAIFTTVTYMIAVTDIAIKLSSFWI